MKSLRRSSLWGTIKIIIIIILLVLITIMCSTLYKQKNQIQITQALLNETVQIYTDKVKEVKTQNTDLTLKITELEKEITATTTEIEVEVETNNVYNITSTEREMLARIVYLEANVESLECQKAVTSVIINRWQKGTYGDTIESVIYAKNQFSPSDKIYKTTPTETNYEAVDYVLQYGSTLPEYVLYFRADRHFDWDGYVGYKIIDKTYFGYITNN